MRVLTRITRVTVIVASVAALVAGAATQAAGSTATKARGACDLLKPTEIEKPFDLKFAAGHAGRNPYSCNYDVQPPDGRHVETDLPPGRRGRDQFAAVKRATGAVKVKGFTADQAVFLATSTIWMQKRKTVAAVSVFLLEVGQHHTKPSSALTSLAKIVWRRM
jgi:hypothetical protein